MNLETKFCKNQSGLNLDAKINMAVVHIKYTASDVKG
jgi:hypothetical protein